MSPSKKGFLLALLLLMCFQLSWAQPSFNILIMDSNYGYSNNAMAQFQAMGHTATVVSSSVLNSTFNYVPYDIVVFGYNSPLPTDLNRLLTENQNGNLGIVVMRGDTTVDDIDMGASGYWNSGGFMVTNNTHCITAPFATGSLPLSFDYKSAITTPTANTTVLGTVGGFASLLIHNTYRRVVMPYYGHPNGMPWNADADSLTSRILRWAAGDLACCTASTAGLTVSTCDSYTGPSGTVFTSSGMVMDTIPNASGCDSVITIDLTIQTNSTSSLTESACDSYTAPSGAIFTSSGTFGDTIPNAAGCDSLITLNLIITTVDTAVTRSGTTLMASATGVTYQWLDCEAGNIPLPGETSQSFTPSANGSYAVEITENGCVDTSNCFFVIAIGQEEQQVNPVIALYPNPGNGTFTVDFGNPMNEVQIQITDLAGKSIYSKTYHRISDTQIHLYAPSGVYLVSIYMAGKEHHSKLVIE